MMMSALCVCACVRVCVCVAGLSVICVDMLSAVTLDVERSLVVGCEEEGGEGGAFKGGRCSLGWLLARSWLAKNHRLRHLCPSLGSHAIDFRA